MKKASVKLTGQEKQEWDDLYQYVKKEILQYDNNQSMPPAFILRLKGLTTGKFIENRSISDKAKYSYKIVLYTFQACKPSIISAIHNKQFVNEMNKFSYITKIVENNINDIYNRVLSAEKTKNKTKSIEINNLKHKGAEYISNSKQTNLKFKELW